MRGTLRSPSGRAVSCVAKTSPKRTMPKLRRAQFKNYDDPLGPRFEGHFVRDQPAGGDTLKVVTYNICQGRNVEGAVEEFRASEPLQAADIILLQEMDETGAERMARELGHNYVYYPASLPLMHGRNLGNAVLSRWPLTQSYKLILPYRHLAVRQTRIAVHARVTVGNREMVVYSVHTEIYSTLVKHRKAQVAALVDDIGPGQGAVIVGGDFNTITRRGVNRMAGQFAEIGLARASEGSGPSIRILGVQTAATDHIFARGFRVLASGVVDTARASDHSPVWTELAWSDHDNT
jgi:endonuclease/exonuclease/phosphatase family metal-dependent hydrolase